MFRARPASGPESRYTLLRPALVHQLYRCAPGRAQSARPVPGADVQPYAACSDAVKAQGVVGLGKVVVRADLDGPVAGVAHHQREGAAAGVEQVFTGFGGEVRRGS